MRGLSRPLRAKSEKMKKGHKDIDCNPLNSKWRRHPDLNRGIAVLQTAALPLGYAALNRTGGHSGSP